VGEIGRPGADVQRKIADRASSSKIFWMKIKKVECKTRPRCMNDQIDFSFFAEKNKFPSQMVSALVWCFFPPQTLCCKHNKWSQLSGLNRRPTVYKYVKRLRDNRINQHDNRMNTTLNSVYNGFIILTEKRTVA